MGEAQAAFVSGLIVGSILGWLVTRRGPLVSVSAVADASSIEEHYPPNDDDDDDGGDEDDDEKWKPHPDYTGNEDPNTM